MAPPAPLLGLCCPLGLHNGYGLETTWVVHSLEGEVVATGSVSGYSAQEDLCLASPGNYTLHVNCPACIEFLYSDGYSHTSAREAVAFSLGGLVGISGLSTAIAFPEDCDRTTQAPSQEPTYHFSPTVASVAPSLPPPSTTTTSSSHQGLSEQAALDISMACTVVSVLIAACIVLQPYIRRRYFMGTKSKRRRYQRHERSADITTIAPFHQVRRLSGSDDEEGEDSDSDSDDDDDGSDDEDEDSEEEEEEEDDIHDEEDEDESRL